MKIFSIFDSKSEAFHVPFYKKAKGEALRDFQDLANDPETSVCKYASDFTLFELGEFNEQTGIITVLPTPMSLGLAQDYKKLSDLRAHPLSKHQVDENFSMGAK